MPLSVKAQAAIRALVTSGINFSNHVADSDHFDEESAYQSISNYAKGTDGLGSCSFFTLDEDGPKVYRTSKVLSEPGAFSNINSEGWILQGNELSNAKKEHRLAVEKFQFREAKDNLRDEVNNTLNDSWEGGKIDRHALIKAFLLQKKSTLDSKEEKNGQILIFGPIPFGYVGYIIPAGVSKNFNSYTYTERMRVVIGGALGNPQVITAYPIK